MADTAEEPKAKVAFFKPRKRKFGGRIRNREEKEEEEKPKEIEKNNDSEHSEDSGSEDEGNVVVKINRSDKFKRGIGSASSNRKVRKRNDSSDESDKDEKGPSAISVTFKANEGVEKRGDMGATSTMEFDTEASKDARAIEERARANRDGVENPLEDKVYRGMNSYAKYIERKDTAAGSAAKRSTGPQRAPANIRATVRWDYAPDICKDYKETGFCGFGDSCKFMHDRGDYKFGWQLEREEKMAAEMIEEDDDKYVISSDDEDLPFKCFLCRESFTHPVVTKCKHYFCEKCALGHYKKSQRCYACGQQTHGTFNPAKDIIAKLDKMKKEEEAKEKAGFIKSVGEGSDSESD